MKQQLITYFNTQYKHGTRLVDMCCASSLLSVGEEDDCTQSLKYSISITVKLSFKW